MLGDGLRRDAIEMACAPGYTRLPTGTYTGLATAFGVVWVAADMVWIWVRMMVGVGVRVGVGVGVAVKVGVRVASPSRPTAGGDCLCTCRRREAEPPHTRRQHCGVRRYLRCCAGIRVASERRKEQRR